jgi:hypothetical protein
MDRRLRHLVRRPSPAVVIALIALVLATGGVTLAAIPNGDRLHLEERRQQGR